MVKLFKQYQFENSTGSLYGFLEPNGAGKTTTLRLVLGLLKKQQGVIKVLGKFFSENRIASLQKIGAMIKFPSHYGHLTANENLRVLQKIYQWPVERISLVLEKVGLGSTGNKKTSSFSLRMK